MIIRDLTEAERAAIDPHHCITSNGYSPCCPYCQGWPAMAGLTHKPAVVRCNEPGCGKQFVAWRRFVPETKSALMPEISPAPT